MSSEPSDTLSIPRAGTTDLDFLFQITGNAFQNRSNRHVICLKAFDNALRLVLASKSTAPPTMADLPMDQPQWLNGLVDFVLRQTSDEAIRKLQKGLKVCGCDMANNGMRELHENSSKGSDGDQDGPRTDTTVFHDLTRRLFVFLTNVFIVCLNTGRLAKLAVLKKNHKPSDAGLVRLAYFLYQKPLDMMAATSSWLKASQSLSCVTFLLYAKTLSRDAFDEHGGVLLGPHLPPVVIDKIQSRVTQLLRDGGSSDRTPFQDANQFMAPLAFMEKMGRKETPLKTQIQFYSPHSQHVYSTACDVLHAVDASQSNVGIAMQHKLLPRLACAAQYAYHCLRLGHVITEAQEGRLLENLGEADYGIDPLVLKYKPAEGDACEADYYGDDEIPAFKMFFFIWSLRQTKDCTNLGCEAPKVSPTDRPRNVCERCKLCKYCSVDCQRQAWNHPEFPHKQLCKQWSALASTWPKDVGEFVAFHDSVKPPDSEMQNMRYMDRACARVALEQIPELTGEMLQGWITTAMGFWSKSGIKIVAPNSILL